MEIRVKDLPGSLGGGGRYDNLVGMFAGQDVPACGFSLGLERIIVVMTERSMFPSHVGQTSEVMVGIWNEATVADSLAIAAELRARGVRVESYPEPDKLAKQFKYAAAIEVPFVVIIGEAEREKDEVAIKNMLSGEQQSLPRNEVAELILSARRSVR